ncbi:MAG: reverse transcriptase family protein, partial [Fusobacteriales bacterium]|nr:reverse transcriptase family protein [Fusobacteriales bacterium]
MWQLINRQIGKTQEFDQKLEIRSGNNLITNPREISNLLNEYFTNTMSDQIKKVNIRGSNPTGQKIDKYSTSVFIHPVMEEEVVKIAKTLRNKSTAGPDEIPECLIKKCIRLIKKPLAHIFNLSLSLGVFPDDWKTAKVIPIYKKGDRKDMKNYRPISIISVFAKLLERLLCKRLMSFFQEYGVLTESQYGFRKGKCIEIAVQSFIEKIQEALDKGVYSVGIFIDLTKAYDTLNHKVLLEKLSSYGIRGITNRWFESYLTNRRQYLEIKYRDPCNNDISYVRSSYKDIKIGVPQESVLGPLLFLLYTNDLPLNIKDANLIMYADDIDVLIIENDANALKRKIEKVTNDLEWWFKQNELIINVNKTGIMSFHNRQKKDPVKPHVNMYGSTLQYVAELKFLGLHITETLNWSSHLQILAQKLSKVSFMLKSLKDSLSTYMIRHIYFTKFQAVLRSGIIFWGGQNGEMSKKVFKIQKRVVRLMAGESSRTSCRQLFKKLNIL